MLAKVAAGRKLSVRSAALVFVAALLALLVMASAALATPAADGLLVGNVLYIMNADGSGRRVLFSQPGIDMWGPAWSPDGQHIVVTFGDPTREVGELYILDATGQNARQLTHNGRNNYLVEWSHDGTRLAFVSQPGNNVQSSEIHTINADGSNEQSLTDNAAWDYGATWSPDDKQLAFGSEAGGRWRIWLMDADGGNQHPFAPEAHGNAPRWSPDGKSIVLKSDREGNDNIYMMASDGTGQSVIAKSPGINTNPTWAPDGRRLAFWSTRNGTSNIYSVNIDGSGLTNLVNDQGLETELPSWSPDGKYIVFHAHPVDTGIVAFVKDNGKILAGLAVLVLAVLFLLLVRRRQVSPRPA